MMRSRAEAASVTSLVISVAVWAEYDVLVEMKRKRGVQNEDMAAAAAADGDDDDVGVHFGLSEEWTEWWRCLWKPCSQVGLVACWEG